MILKRFNVERIAETPDLINELKAEGFQPVAGDDPVPAEPIDIDSMKKDQLIKLAVSRGISGAKSLNKDELLQILKEEDDGTNCRAAGEDPGEA